MTLHHLNIVIRPLARDEAFAVAAWRYDEDLAMYDGEPGQEEALLLMTEEGYGYYALVRNDLVGYCCFGPEGGVPGQPAPTGDLLDLGASCGRSTRARLVGGRLGGMAGLQSQQYRDVIDSLVWHCLEGQGQIGPDRARAGFWNANATADSGDRQHEFNELLASLDEQQRDVLAAMLAQRFEAGVHTTLVVLHEARIEPFEDGYEGAPLHDFVGRLDGWAWPEE